MQKHKPTSIYIALVSAAILFVAAGCSSTPTQGQSERAPRYASRVQVAISDSTARSATAHLDIYDTALPERPYKTIALLTCYGDPKDEGDIASALIYRARMIGADAVLSYVPTVTKHDKSGPLLRTVTRNVFRASAIVYTDK